MAALLKLCEDTQFVIRYFDGKSMATITIEASSREEAIEQFKLHGYLPCDIFSID
ncbi:hypothetical protein ACPV5L_00930 [Vibrio astriarenae]|jgi:hypothetical protein|uniref:Adaptor protein ClpS core domain-containing protein n=1 Tax=Vibrio agarivorans TaxID=153622 RepID=A0ABT7Y5E7_9VIBR|nr:hypothetical protein [Vibrio agarivorans]MDN2483281.1 hypothetical protein [Vibrio agarivorans]MDN3660114.1 hypothetical protein [Vibrio agarivorans]